MVEGAGAGDAKISGSGGGETGSARVGDDGFIHATGADAGGIETVNPANGTQASGDKPKRGRKAGSGKAEATKALAVNVQSLNQVLYSIHAGLAAISHTPELELSEPESKAYADSLAGVLKHYSTSATDKTLSIIQLTFLMAAMYGTRFVAIKKRKEKESLIHGAGASK